MREIKFRAWTGEKMNYGIAPIDSVRYIVFETQNKNAKDLHIKRGEVMEYTGLRDKNGVEIYEGDILDYATSTNDTMKFEIVFHHGSFKRKWINKRTAKIRCMEVEHLAWNTSVIFEVIGNIHENPHLLETKK